MSYSLAHTVHAVLAFFYWSCPWLGNTIRLMGRSLIRNKSLIRPVLGIYWHSAMRIIENPLYLIHPAMSQLRQPATKPFPMSEMSSANLGLPGTFSNVPAKSQPTRFVPCSWQSVRTQKSQGYPRMSQLRVSYMYTQPCPRMSKVSLGNQRTSGVWNKAV